MKNRKRAGALVAAAASFALVLGTATPAEAVITNGTIACPSFMVARLTFTASVPGKLSWTSPVAARKSDTWITSNTSHTYYAKVSGAVKYELRSTAGDGNVGTFTGIYATCVV